MGIFESGKSLCIVFLGWACWIAKSWIIQLNDVDFHVLQVVVEELVLSEHTDVFVV